MPWKSSFGWENPATTKYYNDWEKGKFEIPGLKVSIKLYDGSEFGPCKKVKDKIVPLVRKTPTVFFPDIH